MLGQPSEFVAISGVFWAIAAVHVHGAEHADRRAGRRSWSAARCCSAARPPARSATCSSSGSSGRSPCSRWPGSRAAGARRPRALPAGWRWRGRSAPASRCSGILVRRDRGASSTPARTRRCWPAAVAFLAVIGLTGRLVRDLDRRRARSPSRSRRCGARSARVEEGDFDADVPGRRRQRGRPAAGRLQLDGRRACASASGCATCSAATSAARWPRRRSSATATSSWAASCARSAVAVRRRDRLDARWRAGARRTRSCALLNRFFALVVEVVERARRLGQQVRGRRRAVRVRRADRRAPTPPATRCAPRASSTRAPARASCPSVDGGHRRLGRRRPWRATSAPRSASSTR